MIMKYLREESWTPSKFYAIPDCPIQRHTEDRYKKANYLHLWESVHDEVAVAMRSGTVLCKLDGHTRQMCSENGLVRGEPADRRFRVKLYECPTDKDVEEAYHRFDSRGSVETSKDRSYSLVRKTLGYKPTSAQALTKKTAFEIVYAPEDRTPQSRPDSVLLDELATRPEFMQAIQIIDQSNPRLDPRVMTPAFLQAAIILAVHRDGEAALAFFQNLADSTTHMMDTASACALTMLVYHQSAIRRCASGGVKRVPKDCQHLAQGREGNARMTEYVLAYYEAYRDGRLFEIVQRPDWEVAYGRTVRVKPITALAFLASPKKP